MGLKNVFSDYIFNIYVKIAFGNGCYARKPNQNWIFTIRCSLELYQGHPEDSVF